MGCCGSGWGGLRLLKVVVIFMIEATLELLIRRLFDFCGCFQGKDDIFDLDWAFLIKVRVFRDQGVFRYGCVFLLFSPTFFNHDVTFFASF